MIMIIGTCQTPQHIRLTDSLRFSKDRGQLNVNSTITIKSYLNWKEPNLCGIPFRLWCYFNILNPYSGAHTKNLQDIITDNII